MNIIDFKPQPIGALIGAGRLAVPIHQREYCWEQEEVESLLDDFERGMNAGSEYYLGALVLTQSGSEFSVVDGQQRLATTMLMLAAIRDIFHRVGESKLVKSIEDDYL